MRTLQLAGVIFSVFLCGCVATFPSRPEDQASFFLSKASEALGKGEEEAAISNIESALRWPNGGQKAKELFATNPKARSAYVKHLDRTVNLAASGKQYGKIAMEKLVLASASGTFPAADIEHMVRRVDELVAEGNLNGTLDFDLSDNVFEFPALMQPAHQHVMYLRTLKRLQDTSTPMRPVSQVMDYVAKKGANSPEWKQLEGMLPSLKLRRSELEVVAQLFPRFVETRRKDLTVKVALQVKGDRLFEDDIKQSVGSSIRALQWVENANANGNTIIVERVRHDEKILPEQRQTVSYAQHQVDLMKAALLMPKNATYLYDVVTTGATIEYGYVITAFKDGKKIHDQVVRGRVGGEATRCQNARIQNVFGGVQPAEFVANDDMTSRCQPHGLQQSIDSLRQEVLSQVANGISAVPIIKTARQLD